MLGRRMKLPDPYTARGHQSSNGDLSLITGMTVSVMSVTLLLGTGENLLVPWSSTFAQVTERREELASCPRVDSA